MDGEASAVMGNQAEPMKAILRSGFLALAIMALVVPANAGPFEDGVSNGSVLAMQPGLDFPRSDWKILCR
ncbi:MAG: hypothetical protein OEM91_14585 [Hyphomicrobiales bacterium]|nr:hypothetical protein [Hyphomicrobiales bacterium]